MRHGITGATTYASSNTDHMPVNGCIMVEAPPRRASQKQGAEVRRAHTDQDQAQWRIERVWRQDGDLIVRCQADLRKLETALDDEKVLLKDMRFNLSERLDTAQLARIGQATRGAETLPNDEDKERWTGTEFVWRATNDATHRIEQSDERGQYRLWIPVQALNLYERVAKGGDLGLCEPGTTFIGGGTILAARWRHRTSTDIDIFWKSGRWTPSQENDRLKQWLLLNDEQPKRVRLSPAG